MEIKISDRFQPRQFVQASSYDVSWVDHVTTRIASPAAAPIFPVSSSRPKLKIK